MTIAPTRDDWSRELALGARTSAVSLLNSLSAIDGHHVNVPGRRQPLCLFTCSVSREFDPVAHARRTTLVIPISMVSRRASRARR